MKEAFSRYIQIFTSVKAPWFLLLATAGFMSIVGTQGYIAYLKSLHGIVDSSGHRLGRDFQGTWITILLMKQKTYAAIYSAHIYTEKLHSVFALDGQPWVYPPQYLFWLWPFTFAGDYKTAYIAWSGFCLLVWMIAMFWRSQLTLPWYWIILFAPSVLISLFLGQNGLLTGALLIGGFRLLLPAPWLAGVVFALLSFKPQLGIVIPIILLCLRQYKTFTSAAVTFTLSILISGFVFGWDCWQGFFANMWHMQSEIVWQISSHFISLYAAMLALNLPAAVSHALLLSINIVLVGLLCYRLCHIRQAHWTDWLRIALPVIYLTTPYLFIYDLCALSAGWIFWLKMHEEKKVSFTGSVIWTWLWFIPLASNSLHDAGTDGFPLTPLFLLMAFVLAWQETKPAHLSVNQ